MCVRKRHRAKPSGQSSELPGICLGFFGRLRMGGGISFLLSILGALPVISGIRPPDCHVSKKTCLFMYCVHTREDSMVGGDSKEWFEHLTKRREF